MSEDEEARVACRYARLSVSGEMHRLAQHIERLLAERDRLAARVADLEAALKDVLQVWSFNGDQWHTHTWHTRADWIARHIAVLRELTES